MYANRVYDYSHILTEFTTEVTYRRYFTNLFTKTDKTLRPACTITRDDYKTYLVNFSECVSTKHGLEQNLLNKDTNSKGVWSKVPLVV